MDHLGEEPWKNESLLRKLYHDQQLTTYDIAEKLGCSQPNVGYWMEKYSIETRPSPSERHRTNDAPWKTRDTMYSLYVEDERSIPEISARLGCAETTIWEWLERHDINKRQPGRKPTPEKLMDSSWLREQYTVEQKSSREIANQIGCDKSTVLDWLSRNDIEVRSTEASAELKDRESMWRLYVEEELTMDDIADRFDCGRTTVSTWLSRHGIESRPSAAELKGPESPHWNGGQNIDYGDHWEEIAEEVREYDDYRCVRCKIAQEEHENRYGRDLPVHHNIPVSDFVTDGELDESRSHRLDNLVTVCVVCHPTIEKIPLDLRHRRPERS